MGITAEYIRNKKVLERFLNFLKKSYQKVFCNAVLASIKNTWITPQCSNAKPVMQLVLWIMFVQSDIRMQTYMWIWHKTFNFEKKYFFTLWLNITACRQEPSKYNQEEKLCCIYVLKDIVRSCYIKCETKLLHLTFHILQYR